jgi:hypothetical protein
LILKFNQSESRHAANGAPFLTFTGGVVNRWLYDKIAALLPAPPRADYPPPSHGWHTATSPGRRSPGHNIRRSWNRARI